MKKNYALLLSILSPVVLGLFFAGTLYHGGSPGGKTGSPGDGSNCTSCHSGSPNNAAAWITSDIPGLGYVVGETYTITAMGTHSGVGRFGFELTSEDESGSKVGQFTVSGDGQTQLANGGNSITHTSSGTTPSGDSKTWTFEWTAPSTDVGLVTFYAAFNAANSNGGTSGDVIYLSNMSADESSIGINDNIENIEFTISPNPSFGNVSIKHDISVANIVIIDLSGKTVYEQEKYTSTERIDLSFLNKGIYLVQLKSGQEVITKKLLLK